MVKSTRMSSKIVFKIENNNNSKKSPLPSKAATPHQPHKKELKTRRRNTPVNVVIWAMRALNGRNRGVPIEKLSTFIEKNFEIPCERCDINKKIHMTVMFAVTSGILQKCHGLYYLRSPKCNRFPIRG